MVVYFQPLRCVCEQIGMFFSVLRIRLKSKMYFIIFIPLKLFEIVNQFFEQIKMQFIETVQLSKFLTFIIVFTISE